MLSGKEPINDSSNQLLNLAMMVETKTDNSPITKEQLKLKAKDLSHKLVEFGGDNYTTSIYSGDKMFSSLIFNASAPNITDQAIKYNHPIYNMTECQSILKKAYNITTVIFATNNFEASLNKDNTNQYTITAYDLKTKQSLDLGLCNNITQTISIPITNTTGLNLTLYKEMKVQGIDILNPNDPFYTDRCISYTDNSTSADTTLNWRRKTYLKGKMPLCVGLNCTYQGLDTNNYLNCQCQGMQSDTPIYYQLLNVFTDSLSQLNLGIILCYKIIPVT
jgi:hypothetical protein